MRALCSCVVEMGREGWHCPSLHFFLCLCLPVPSTSQQSLILFLSYSQLVIARPLCDRKTEKEMVSPFPPRSFSNNSQNTEIILIRSLPCSFLIPFAHSPPSVILLSSSRALARLSPFLLLGIFSLHTRMPYSFPLLLASFPVPSLSHSMPLSPLSLTGRGSFALLCVFSLTLSLSFSAALAPTQ